MRGYRAWAGAAAWAFLLTFLPMADSAAQDAASVERLVRETLQPMLGTVSVEAKPIFAGGQLDGCTVEFNLFAQDWTYKQGGYIRIGGSFGVMSAKGKFAPVLKVVLHDLDPSTMNLTPSPPVSAYFVSGNRTTKDAVAGSFPSDVPGAIFVVFQLDPTFQVIAEGLSNNKVTIAFARKKGGADIQVPIDTGVVETSPTGKRTRSAKATTDFFQCTRTLVEPGK